MTEKAFKPVDMTDRSVPPERQMGAEPCFGWAGETVDVRKLIEETGVGFYDTRRPRQTRIRFEDCPP